MRGENAYMLYIEHIFEQILRNISGVVDSVSQHPL